MGRFSTAFETEVPWPSSTGCCRFLGPESVRADNALALAAEEERFDELRRALFSAQPAEGSGGFTTAYFLVLGRQVGLTSPLYTSGVEGGRYQAWVLRCEEA